MVDKLHRKLKIIEPIQKFVFWAITSIATVILGSIVTLFLVQASHTYQLNQLDLKTTKLEEQKASKEMVKGVKSVWDEKLNGVLENQKLMMQFFGIKENKKDK